MTSLKDKAYEEKFDLDEFGREYTGEKYHNMYFEKDVKEAVLEFQNILDKKFLNTHEDVDTLIINIEEHFKRIFGDFEE